MITVKVDWCLVDFWVPRANLGAAAVSPVLLGYLPAMFFQIYYVIVLMIS